MIRDPGYPARSRELMSIDPSPIAILIVGDHATLHQGIAALVNSGVLAWLGAKTHAVTSGLKRGINELTDPPKVGYLVPSFKCFDPVANFLHSKRESCAAAIFGFRGRLAGHRAAFPTAPNRCCAHPFRDSQPE